MAAVLAARSGARFYRTPTTLLADPPRDVALLRRPHAVREDVANPQGVALKTRLLHRTVLGIGEAVRAVIDRTRSRRRKAPAFWEILR